MDIKTIGQRITEIRVKQDLTQKEFAKSLDVAQPVLNRAEKGEQKPSATMLSKFIRIGVSVNWLLTGHGSMFLDKEPDTKENISGLTGIDGNVDTYPQVDHVTKIAKTKWWEGLSAVKKFIIAGLDEIQDEEFLSMTKNNINFQVLKERAEKEEEEKEKLKQKGAAG